MDGPIQTVLYLVDVVIEVDVSSAQVTAKHCGMSREDGGYVEVVISGHKEANASNPLMKMCSYVGHFWQVLHKLHTHTSRIRELSLNSK